jgi:hypothetical protein
MTSNALRIAKPQESEHDPYYSRYISLVPGNDVIETLRQQISATVELLSGLSESVGNHRYAPSKWSVKQMLGHLCDAERIFAYRALRIARGDVTPIEGFEQDDYVRNGPFEHYRLADLVEEFAVVRRATVLLFEHLEEAHWMRIGTANGKVISARALAYIIAGHELHHRNELQQKYLAAAAQGGR